MVYRSPNGSASFNTYSGQIAVSVQETQWTEDDYSRTQSSSVSPRGGYCSNTSTPHSSGGSYSSGNGYGSTPSVSSIGSPSTAVFNSSSSKYVTYFPTNHNGSCCLRKISILM